MFFVIPVGVEHKADRSPVVTLSLVGICTAVFLLFFGLALVKGSEVYEWELENLWLIPATSHLWAYLTSLFVHADFLHLIGNMVYLFLFGACVEDMIGRGRFLVFYLGGGLFAALVYVLAAPQGFHSDIPMGGASGAISACIGGFVPYFWRTKIEFKLFWWFFIRGGASQFFLPAWAVIAFWFATDLFGAVQAGMEKEAEGGVAFAAHVGGTVYGFLLISLQRWLARRAEKAEQEKAINDQVDQSAPATILLLIQGEQHGPFNRAGIRAMSDMGSIPADSMFWCEGMADWRPVSELVR